MSNKENLTKFMADAFGKNKSSKKFKLTGTLHPDDTVNANGVLYSSDLLQKEVGRYQEDMISNNRAVGVIYDDSVDPDSVVDFQKVSHMITELKCEGNDKFVAEVKILNTPCGKILKELIESKCSMGFSARKIGDTIVSIDAVRTEPFEFQGIKVLEELGYVKDDKLLHSVREKKSLPPKTSD